MINDIDYEDIKFPVSAKDSGKIEKKNNICINVFCYENELTYSIYVLDQKLLYGSIIDNWWEKVSLCLHERF